VSKTKVSEATAYLNEIRGTGPVINLYGRDFTLQPTLPLTAILKIRTIEESRVDESSTDQDFYEKLDEAIGLVKSLLSPQNQIDVLLNELSADFTMLEVFIDIALGYYNGKTVEDVLEARREQKSALDPKE